MTEAEKLDMKLRAIELEKRMARRVGFWRGFAVGMLVLIAMLVAGVFTAYLFREDIAVSVINKVGARYAEDLFAAFPEAYMTNNREKVLDTLDGFTNAVAANHVPREQIEVIGRQVLEALRDKRISYQEMDAILEALQQLSR